MITEFSMCDSFLKSKYFQDVSLSVTHDVFIKNWKSYGVLVAHANNMIEYGKAIESLPAKYKSRWKTVFSNAKIHYIDAASPKIEEMQSFDEAKALNAIFDTAFLEETLSYLLCANDSVSRYCDQTLFEIVGAPSLSESVNMQRSIAACETDISDKDNIGEIWETRFKKLAKHSKRIFVSDRYLFARALQDHGRSVVNTNIKAFCEYLLSEGGEYYLVFASDGGAKDSQSHVELVNYFEWLLKNYPELRKVLKRLTLLSNDEEVFKRYSHDRYIRFEGHVCEIGNGMTIFERHALSNTTFNIKLQHLTNSEAIERELRIDPFWTEVIIS